MITKETILSLKEDINNSVQILSEQIDDLEASLKRVNAHRNMLLDINSSLDQIVPNDLHNKIKNKATIGTRASMPDSEAKNYGSF